VDHAALVMNINKYKITYENKTKFKSKLPQSSVRIFLPKKMINGCITICSGHIVLLDLFIAVLRTIKLRHLVSVADWWQKVIGLSVVDSNALTASKRVSHGLIWLLLKSTNPKRLSRQAYHNGTRLTPHKYEWNYIVDHKTSTSITELYVQ
jgi:hypothetical protein